MCFHPSLAAEQFSFIQMLCEKGCRGGAREGKVVFCHSGGKGDEGGVWGCAGTKSVFTLKAASGDECHSLRLRKVQLCFLAVASQPGLCALLCHCVPLQQVRLLTSAQCNDVHKALVAGSVNTGVEGR